MPVGAKFNILLGNFNLDGHVHEVTVGNLTESGSGTWIEDATMNACTAGVWVATWVENYGGGTGPRYDAPLIVRYDSAEERWRVFNIGGVPIPVGGAISLLGFAGNEPADCTPSSRQTISTRTITAYEHEATEGNTSVQLTRSYGYPNPFEFLFVTQAVGSAIPTSPIGVLYDFFEGTWAIYNIDPMKPMPVGTKFYVLQTRPVFWDGFESGNTNVWSATVS